MDIPASVNKCIACKKRKSEQELMRVVKNKNQILVDPRGDLPGRGAYLCPDELCVNKARENKLLKKELKTDIPDDFYAEILEKIGSE